jgi:transposase
MVDQKGMTMREVSEALGINDGMLWRWRKEYKEGKLQSFPGNGRMSDKDAEIARLRQENRRLQAERDILKKATALFARPM